MVQILSYLISKSQIKLMGLSGERPKEFFVTTPIAGLHAAKEVSVIGLTGEVL
jgi:hypothetical protein